MRAAISIMTQAHAERERQAIKMPEILVDFSFVRVYAYFFITDALLAEE